MRSAFKLALEALEPESTTTLENRLAAAQHASHAEWEAMEEQASHSSLRSMLIRPWSVFEVLAYWKRFPHVVIRFADQFGIKSRFLITGHTHHLLHERHRHHLAANPQHRPPHW